MNFNFPKIPASKTFSNNMTPEGGVIIKLGRGENISAQEESILKEAIVFYKEAYACLKAINLAELKEEDLEKVLEFLKSVFRIEMTITDNIRFNDVFRVTIVKDNFLEADKVKNLGYIKNPPIEIIKKFGVYGRANTPNSTIFYCAFDLGVALLETKPEVGERIIIAQWRNVNALKFKTYVIANNKTIKNERLQEATTVFQAAMQNQHPLYAEIFDLYMDFVSSEFVKNIEITNPKKYEYLFSSFFADRICSPSFDPMIDCIKYPSIAINYNSENLAIKPQSLNKLTPFRLEDCIVTKTMYDISGSPNTAFPIIKTVLRRSTKFEGNRIIWEDD
jgi:RES domain